jgi:uncharacterized membrane protein YgaE (UPF0421/DUF939 family)
MAGDREEDPGVFERQDVTGPLPRVSRDATEIRRRGEVLLDEMAARSRADVRVRLHRLRVAAPLILQAAVAAGLAWRLALWIGAGSGPPFFAPVAAVVSVGFAIGQRLRRTVELVLGVSLGVGLGDLLMRGIGNGTGQLMLVVVLATTAAVLLDGGQLLVTQAATSSVLVAALVPTNSGVAGLDRCLNAFIGGAVGVTVGLLLLPLNPITLARRTTLPVTEGMADGLAAVAAALRAADVDAARAALAALRAMNAKVTAMSNAVASSAEIARIAPMRWRVRERFVGYVEAAPQLDYAVRNSRVLARRSTVVLRLGHAPPPQLAEAIAALAEAARCLGEELGSEHRPAVSRRLLVAAYATARGSIGPDTPQTVLVVVAELRAVVYDLLRAAGLNRVEALALLDN